VSLLGGDPELVRIIRAWDFDNPNEEELNILQDYVLKSVDKVKTEIVVNENKLKNCTSMKVKAGNPENSDFFG
jgi:hypothetical protein